ncbi:MAG TPA: hypothetical protein VHN15_14040, partial [Thermoanaerobaculia bacterium]|nr:hypothetical protein [Thermoanaerobaculia bacterium]
MTAVPGRRAWWGSVALAACAVLAPAAAGAAPPPGSGLVVEEVRPGTAGQKAGLLRGDILVSWRR